MTGSVASVMPGFGVYSASKDKGVDFVDFDEGILLASAANLPLIHSTLAWP